MLLSLSLDFFSLTVNVVELLCPLFVQVNERTNKVWHTHAKSQEVHQGQVKVEVQLVRQRVTSSAVAFDDWQCGDYQQQREQVLCHIQNVEGGHSEPVNPIVLELQIQHEIRVISMAQQLCYTPKVHPVSNESVLRFNISFEQTYKRVVGNDAKKDEELA